MIKTEQIVFSILLSWMCPEVLGKVTSECSAQIAAVDGIRNVVAGIIQDVENESLKMRRSFEAIDQEIEELNRIYEATKQGCPPGWNATYLSCFKLFNQHESWVGAQAACRQMNATLMEIHYEIKDLALRDLMHRNGIYESWIGLSDRLVEGQWRWNSGTTLGSYDNWGSKEPNDAGGQEDCVQAHRVGVSYYWNDQVCGITYKIPFACERPSV